VKYREAARKLRCLGREQVRRRGRGSHRMWRNLQTDKLAPLQDWGSKHLNPWTLRDAIRQLRLDWKDFEQAKFTEDSRPAECIVGARNVACAVHSTLLRIALIAGRPQVFDGR